MGLFEHWPYVNFHDLNLDWIIKEFPKVYKSRDEAQASAEASAESAAASQLSADAALASQEASRQSELNAAQSEENAADSEANAKNYADHIADPVAGLVTDWLEDNITPTTPAVDASLTVSGAAADAKVTGDKIAEVNTTFNDLYINGTLTLRESLTPSNWGIGGIDGNGANVNQSTFCRLKESNAFYANKQTIIENVSGGVYVYAYAYNDQACTNFVTDYATLNYQGVTKLILPAGYYYRLKACYIPPSGLSVDDIEIILQKFTVYETTTVSDLKKEVNVVNSKITGIENGGRIEAVFENRDYTADNVNIYEASMLVSNAWISPDGQINSSTGSYYAKIPVFNGDSYQICYNSSNPNFTNAAAGGYLLQDAEGNAITNIKAQELPDGADIGSFKTKIITIPKDAAYLLITLKLGNTWDNRNSFTIYRSEASDGYITGLLGAKIKSVSKWSGVKWAAVGDSITEHNIRATKNYDEYINEVSDITVENMGRSGSGYKRTDDEGYAFYQRINNVPIDTDVVTIFGSGNDLNYTAMGFNSFAEALGNVTDTGTGTICGCINTTIENLYSILPTVKLGIITPCPWESFNPANTDNNMDLYSQAIVEICKMHGIPCLDLYHCSGLRPWDSTYRSIVYSRDGGNGVHPNELGQNIIASHISSFLGTIII